jgi:hypothetical protein
MHFIRLGCRCPVIGGAGHSEFHDLERRRSIEDIRKYLWEYPGEAAVIHHNVSMLRKQAGTFMKHTG